MLCWVCWHEIWLHIEVACKAWGLNCTGSSWSLQKPLLVSSFGDFFKMHLIIWGVLMLHLYRVIHTTDHQNLSKNLTRRTCWVWGEALHSKGRAQANEYSVCGGIKLLVWLHLVTSRLSRQMVAKACERAQWKSIERRTWGSAPEVCTTHIGCCWRKSRKSDSKQRCSHENYRVTESNLD